MPDPDELMRIFHEKRIQDNLLKQQECLELNKNSPFSTENLKTDHNLGGDFHIKVSDRIKVKLYLPKTGKDQAHLPTRFANMMKMANQTINRPIVTKST